MGKQDKLLTKARNNPSGLSFDEFRALMKGLCWEEDRQKGSHQIWYSPKRYRLSVQNRKGKAKGYQVKQFLLQVEREANDERFI
jgi:predicted RNA binding protein YcfA (HicA-like mRNA interferase family)